MDTLGLFLAAAMGAAAPDSGATGVGLQATPTVHTDAIEIGMILKHGDTGMRLADQCLKNLFRVEGDGDTAEVLRILNLTDFDLSKVTVREVKANPARIRFGFEFTKADELKTVYWEADCPTDR